MFGISKPPSAAAAAPSAAPAPRPRRLAFSIPSILHTIGRTTLMSTIRVRSAITPVSISRSRSSLVGLNSEVRSGVSTAGAATGVSAKRRFTTSSWSPRFLSNPTAVRTSAAMRSSSSCGRG